MVERFGFRRDDEVDRLTRDRILTVASRTNALVFQLVGGKVSGPDLARAVVGTIRVKKGYVVRSATEDLADSRNTGGESP